MDLPIYKLRDFPNANGYHIRRYTDTQHAMHFHDCIELTIMEKGSGMHVLNGREYYFPTYAFTIMDHRDYHAYYNLTAGNSLYNLMIAPHLISNEQLEKLSKLNTDKICFFDKELGRVVISLFDSLFYMKKLKAPIEPRFIRNVCDNVIDVFLEKFANQGVIETNSKKSEIQPALEYINLHFKENISLKTVAEYANYNPAHFSKLFHKKMGVPFNHYVASTRINYAKRLLTGSEHSISFICFECGFSSVSSFNRNFAEIVGTSPSAYRAEFKQ